MKVSYEILETIVNQDIQSWKATLSKAKGIYLIVDSKTGKHYVGQAIQAMKPYGIDGQITLKTDMEEIKS